MRVKLVQVDGHLPNIALMKLAHWHRRKGHEVTLSTTLQPALGEKEPDRVYASAIFDHSQRDLAELKKQRPDIITGGTGDPENLIRTVEDVMGRTEYERLDYSIYPEYPWSLGFSQRGCRLRCGFCLVPRTEGRPRAANSIAQIWRPATERKITLLDNDFFGQPEEAWRRRITELVDGNFRVCFSQGLNIRLVNEEQAEALATLKLRNSDFTRRRLYTAWDNLGQEKIFFNGLERLEKAGIPPTAVMVYMLTGYDPKETIEKVLYRYNALVKSGCMPYPMVYDDTNRTLKQFQRWVIGRYHEFVSWDDYRTTPPPETPDEQLPLWDWMDQPQPEAAAG